LHSFKRDQLDSERFFIMHSWFQQGYCFRQTPAQAMLPPLDDSAAQQQWLQGFAQAHQAEVELLLLCDCDAQGSEFEWVLPSAPMYEVLQARLPPAAGLTAQLLAECLRLQQETGFP
jgi:hypothetical protein